MSEPLAILILVLVLVPASYVGIEAFRRASLKRGWFDVPNERSQHSQPVPRGGGIVIAILCLMVYVALAAYTGTPFAWGYFVGAVILTGISWLDDLRSLGFTVRILVHLAVSIMVILSCGYWTEIGLPGTTRIHLGVFGAIVTTVWIVWIINSYNFMDGIDGIAGLQAVVTSAAWASLAWLMGAGWTTLYAVAIGAVATGFLIKNWAPAKIFMGDVGSAFLGFTFASMPLLLAAESGSEPSLPILAALFLWPFMIDSGVNRFRRAMRGIRFWEPNREHFYQRLVDNGVRTPAVAAAYGLISAVVAALAIVSFRLAGNAPVIYILLVLLVTALGAIAVSIKTKPGKGIDRMSPLD